MDDAVPALAAQNTPIQSVGLCCNAARYGFRTSGQGINFDGNLLVEIKCPFKGQNLLRQR
jgi:hypothetical protein